MRPQTILLLRRKRVGQGLITVESCLQKPRVPAKWLGSHAFYQVQCRRGKECQKQFFSPAVESSPVDLLLK